MKAERYNAREKNENAMAERRNNQQNAVVILTVNHKDCRRRVCNQYFACTV